MLTNNKTSINTKVQVIHTFGGDCLKNLNLVNARKNKQLTQADLARELKVVTKASVSNWENGYSKPRLEVAISVAKILEKEVAFLFKF